MVKKTSTKKSNSDAVDFEELKKELAGGEILTAKEFLSTGSTLLDYAIANRRDGGIPVGRITEISGMEATGKSLLAFHILAETQRRGGIGIYIDIERAADEEFMRRMGVDKDKLIYPQPVPKSIEDVFQYIENVVKVVRTRWPNKEKIVTIVWDSVAATQAKSTVELDFGAGSITPEARAMSSCFKKAIDMLELGYVTLVCINQLREKIGVMFGDNKTTPHGKALPFYASTRLRLTSAGKVKNGNKKSDRTIGVNCKAQVVKNKVGPAHRSAEFPIMFDWGVDDAASWMDHLKECGSVKTAGAWSTLYLDGEEHKFQGTAGWREVLEKPGVKEKVLDIIEKSLVITFEKPPEEILVEDAITEE